MNEYELKNPNDKQLKQLLELPPNSDDEKELFSYADKIRREVYGTDVYIRGLIEVSNYCKNNCYYCGIRCGNNKLTRYRLSLEDIINCTNEGYDLGFRTFVLQGGEDNYYTDDIVCRIVSTIKKNHPDCAVTISLGEKSRKTYQDYYDAGADRYLLRHETADEAHYKMLHPKEMSFKNRMECLYNLKDIGYQTGCGIMVGSPYQTTEHIIKDIRFMQDFKPDMIGVGPYLVHHDTPFFDKENGSLYTTLHLLAILRILMPNVLLPATTALGTVDKHGQEMGLACGANVIMPNLSPSGVRKLYSLYENKICTGSESAQCRQEVNQKVENAGYKVVVDRGDVKRPPIQDPSLA